VDLIALQDLNSGDNWEPMVNQLPSGEEPIRYV
jgi:hypothetical protein